MSLRAKMLQHERKKLDLLRQRVAQQEQHVLFLESLKDDPLDQLLESELAAALEPREQTPAMEVQTPADEQVAVQEAPMPVAPSPLAPVFQWGQQQRAPRRVPGTWVSLLRFIGREGKSYDDVKLYIKDRGLPITEGAARTQLMAYRKQFGFVENPRKGFYVATDRALSFIEEQEKKSPARQDGGFGAQPIPMTRAAA